MDNKTAVFQDNLEGEMPNNSRKCSIINTPVMNNQHQTKIKNTSLRGLCHHFYFWMIINPKSKMMSHSLPPTCKKMVVGLPGCCCFKHVCVPSCYNPEILFGNPHIGVEFLWDEHWKSNQTKWLVVGWSMEQGVPSGQSLFDFGLPGWKRKELKDNQQRPTFRTCESFDMSSYYNYYKLTCFFLHLTRQNLGPLISEGLINLYIFFQLGLRDFLRVFQGRSIKKIAKLKKFPEDNGPKRHVVYSELELNSNTNLGNPSEKLHQVDWCCTFHLGPWLSSGFSHWNLFKAFF